MRKVDLLEMSVQNATKFSGQYMGVPQPMYIFHSEAELDEHIENPIKIRNIEEYTTLIEKYKEEGKNYISFVNHSVYLLTPDRWMPDYTDETGKVHYKVLPNGEYEPVDSVWIALYNVGVFAKKHFIFTSSGIWTVSISEWNFSGGPKSQFSAVSRPATTSKDVKERKRLMLEGLVSKKKPSAGDVRFIHTILNPTSPLFLNFSGAMRAAYRGRFNGDDYKFFMNSKFFRKILMKEIATLYPGLSEAIQKEIPPDEFAKFIRQMIEKSIKSETSKEVRDALSYIAEAGYGKDPEAGDSSFRVIGGRVGLPMHQTSPILPERTKGTEDIKSKDIDKYPDKNEEMSEKELKEHRAMHGVTASFVMRKDIDAMPEEEDVEDLLDTFSDEEADSI